MFQSSWFQLSAIDWIKSPLEVPIPTQREASPVDPVGAFGKTSVDVASRIQERRSLIGVGARMACLLVDAYRFMFNGRE
jgi:hypothetical protein